MMQSIPLEQTRCLLDLSKRARQAKSDAELRFLVLNQTYQLKQYAFAILWLKDQGVMGVSHVSTIDQQSPLILFANQLALQLSKQTTACAITPTMVTPYQFQEWPQYFPAHGLWLPFNHSLLGGAILLFNDKEWQDADIDILREWIDAWSFLYQTQHKLSTQQYLIQSGGRFLGKIPSYQSLMNAWGDIQTGARYVYQTHLSDSTKLIQSVRQINFLLKRLILMVTSSRTNEPWWSLRAAREELKDIWMNRSRRYFWIMMLVLFYPVRLTVSLPAEVVALQPAVIRVPIEGVVDQFFVQPNQQVVEGQMLFKLDTTTLASKLQVAKQETQVAGAEYRQGSLQSLVDAKSRLALAGQQGKTLEKQIEAEYVKEMLEKSQIKAPVSGVAIFDDPSSWLGKPVMAGEKVLIIAKEDHVEIEAWLSLSDILAFPDHARMVFHLHSSPLSPIVARVKYIGHEPLARPDGSYAYRVRASLTRVDQLPRIGLKGTSKIHGQFVPLSYWLMRKPLAKLRQVIGW